VPVSGGSVEAIADVNDPRGLSWHAPDVITYSPEAIGGVFEIAPSAGAVRKPLTTLAKGTERTHRWPSRLPNGVLLFTVGSMNSPDNYDNATIEAWLPKTGQRKVILKGAAMARYVPPGYLLFVREASLFAVPFDVDRLEVTGTPTPIVKRLAGDGTTGAANFDEAAGTFAYVPAASETTLHRLVWMDRSGRPEPLDLPPGQYFDVSVSPDGSRAAMIVAGNGGTDVWVYGFARKTLTRLTFGGSHRTPIWSHDGSFVYYVAAASDGSSVDIDRKPADGSRDEERLTTLKLLVFLRGVTPDGRELLLDYATPTNKTDIATFELKDGAKPVPLVARPFDEYAVKWSTDRRFVAYQSDESSRPEIYVREASGQGGRWQVSTQGGEEPRRLLLDPDLPHDPGRGHRAPGPSHPVSGPEAARRPPSPHRALDVPAVAVRGRNGRRDLRHALPPLPPRADSGKVTP
jgi:serine/threonine-protein kinase